MNSFKKINRTKKNFFLSDLAAKALEFKKSLFAPKEFFGHLCSHFRIKT